MTNTLERPSFLSQKDPTKFDDLIFRLFGSPYPSDEMLHGGSIIVAGDTPLFIFNRVTERFEEILSEQGLRQYRAYNPARKKLSRHTSDRVSGDHIYFDMDGSDSWEIASLQELVKEGIVYRTSNREALIHLGVGESKLTNERRDLSGEVFVIPNEQSLNIAVGDRPPRTFSFS